MSLTSAPGALGNDLRGMPLAHKSRLQAAEPLAGWGINAQQPVGQGCGEAGAGDDPGIFEQLLRFQFGAEFAHGVTEVGYDGQEHHGKDEN